tara:strand:+ start:1351 stop:1770 length:420 start_codon:yes stop_codon:yes gene_type:complete
MRKHYTDEFGEQQPVYDGEFLRHVFNDMQGRASRDVGFMFDLTHEVSPDAVSTNVKNLMELYVEKMTDVVGVLDSMMKLIDFEDRAGKYEVTIENRMFGYEYPPRKVVVEANGVINAYTEACKIDMYAVVVGEPKFIGE